MELAAEIRNDIEVNFASTYDDVFRIVFPNIPL